MIDNNILTLIKESEPTAVWLESNANEVIRYDYDLESYLEEQGCKNIVESSNEYLFTFEKEVEA